MMVWHLQTEAARSRRSRPGSQRGTTLVEAAIVTVPFFFIIFAIIELGLQVGTVHAVTGSVKAGSRTASAAAADAMADFTILDSIKPELGGLPRGGQQITRIVIYRSSAQGAAPTTQCSTGSATPGVCNVYTRADLNRPATDFGCKVVGTLDSNWCPTSRKTALTAATGGPPDYIGIYIEVVHQRVSGLLGTNKTIRDHSVNRIEPAKP
jgi:Flp pilus assembly protein TadG